MDVPDGYSTYSALLIPQYDWFEQAGVQSAYKFLTHFKKVGQLLGPEHLTFWFYYTYCSYRPQIDAEVIAAVSDHISSQEELNAFAKSHLGGQRMAHGGYDVARARLICAALSLDYAKGPFVAFFTTRPSLPYHYQGESSGGPGLIGHGDNFTAPTRVLQLGGLSLTRSCQLMDELEQILLSRPLATDELRWKQIWLHIEQWCASNRDALLKVITAVVTRKLSSSDSSKEAG
jgi:hypothetical protein